MLDKNAKLVLEDGTEFSGFSFGHEQGSSGEVVFNTGMVGYPETFTDPSYKGQILALTYPLIGNYGVPDGSVDQGMRRYFESDRIHISGLIISDYSRVHNHWNSARSLSEWLQENRIPAICGIDTRALTKKLRHKGVMLGKVVFDDDIELYDPNKDNLVEKVSCKNPEIFDCDKKKSIGKTVILIDCGCKYNIIRSLLARGLKVIRVPWDHDIHSSGYAYDGVFISNGPGDPRMCEKTVETIKKEMERKDGKPVFGICLGNQLLARAAGAKTFKLKFGHRSQNQPCIEVGTKRCYITSQNHGFAVDDKSLPSGWRPWFTNANDGTNEGIMHKSGRWCSVQFHPEATPGPKDTDFLFERFVEMIR